VCEKNSTKGRGLRVVGRLKQNRWKDADGKTQSKIFVVAEHIEYKPKTQKDFENGAVNSSSPKTVAYEESYEDEAVF
jgi:single-strand DNA-binding protein